MKPSMQDASCQARYQNRTSEKTEAILRACEFEGKCCLDVGCNRGELAGALIDHGATVTGLDVVDVVPAELKAHPKFHWVEGDIAEVPIAQTYDFVLVLSVLHHVLGHHGWEVFEETWEKILNAAPTVIFEIGMPSEEGNYYWKEPLIDRLMSDSGWIKQILGNKRVRSRNVIGCLPIHGSVRHIYRIETTATMH